ncbi:MAG TPA: prepilin-type N-terminal cleavage/methylation domain-containing protein, partial [Usitatibacter sp.]|nr:prepilin-type N-terminal cleavage/methylation domain-containing protein [Usitatibacter sp.]
MRLRPQGGFTLIELVVAMVLLGAMMSLLYSGLTFALKSWDAADANGRRVADRRIGENFLRREIAETFPLRWKDPAMLRFAFDGSEHELRFVSSRPAGLAQGGLALVGVGVEDDPQRPRVKNLVMRRALAGPEAADFKALEEAKPSILAADVQAVEFSYFGAENDFSEPAWRDDWPYPWRIPTLVRLRMRAAGGVALPEMLMPVMVGEEAG